MLKVWPLEKLTPVLVMVAAPSKVIQPLSASMYFLKSLSLESLSPLVTLGAPSIWESFGVPPPPGPPDESSDEPGKPPPSFILLRSLSEALVRMAGADRGMFPGPGRMGIPG